MLSVAEERRGGQHPSVTTAEDRLTTLTIVPRLIASQIVLEEVSQ